jgi:hypothetical protein
MAGRPPRPPKGWEDDSTPDSPSGGSVVTDAEARDKNPEGPMGDPDPAGQH